MGRVGAQGSGETFPRGWGGRASGDAGRWPRRAGAFRGRTFRSEGKGFGMNWAVLGKVAGRGRKTWEALLWGLTTGDDAPGIWWVGPRHSAPTPWHPGRPTSRHHPVLNVHRAGGGVTPRFMLLIREIRGPCEAGAPTSRAHSRLLRRDRGGGDRATHPGSGSPSDCRGVWTAGWFSHPVSRRRERHDCGGPGNRTRFLFP